MDYLTLVIFGAFMGFLGGFFLNIPKWGNIITVTMVVGFIVFGFYNPGFWSTPPPWTFYDTLCYLGGSLLGYAVGKQTVKEVWKDFGLS